MLVVKDHFWDVESMLGGPQAPCPELSAIGRRGEGGCYAPRVPPPILMRFKVSITISGEENNTNFLLIHF